jgi:2-polyprenyl-6-methoxyphenol hydroxylase-like FAD-dependent oxidoreductase
VREALGIGYEDLGFVQDWLVIDARAKRPPRPDLPLLRQFCEPKQPGMTMQMGPHHRRWSFMIFPGESAAEAVKHENVWRRLNRPEGATPNEFELIRVASYKFQSLIAPQWRAGRVFLAGDAAHQMPPFLAQGLCSGFRDAHNLAWKLDLVLRGLAGPAFLDSYTAERGPNARATVVESMRVGQNVNERDPERIKARDAQLLALQAAQQKPSSEKKLIAFRVGFSARIHCPRWPRCRRCISTGAGSHRRAGRPV